jgi:hypothetical protein
MEDSKTTVTGNEQMTTITKRFGIGLVCIFAFALAACGGSEPERQ